MKNNSFLKIIIPSLTVFVSSACIMIIELVASRLIARHLGSSLYTWTSVIGVVLAGITIGNYLGGRIADKFKPQKSLSALFCLASISCVAIIILNNVIGTWMFLWNFSWPVRVFSHVSLVFLLPSVLLGTISPVVAKMALDRGLPVGRTVGDIYAWGAAGSIAGTFLAGFYLIATIGTISILWIVAGILLLIAVLYFPKSWPLFIWFGVLFFLMYLGNSQSAWAKDTGSNLKIREKENANILYEDETPYCWVSVQRTDANSEKLVFYQDKLMHSQIVLTDLDSLQYFYEQIYAIFTHALSNNKKSISTLTIGGGGYVFPRYLENHWPEGRTDVVEIDPGVTEAAHAAFGLSRTSSINTITLDARNYVQGLIEKMKTGENTPKYDFIYEDALDHYSIPFQLVTREFNEMIFQLLEDDGAYMIEMIDVYKHGLFLGSMLNTLEETFPYVYALSEKGFRNTRNTYVLIASKKAIDVENIISAHPKGNDIWIKSREEIDALKNKADMLVITDDFAPIEALMAPVIKESASEIAASSFLDRAKKFKNKGDFEESIRFYRKAAETEPLQTVIAYNEIGLMQVRLGLLYEAVESFKAAIIYNENLEESPNIPNLYYNLGTLLTQLKQSEESKKYLQVAIEGLKLEIKKNPDDSINYFMIGDSYARMGNYSQASIYLNDAVNKNPYNEMLHIKLAEMHNLNGNRSDAISGLKKAIGFFELNKMDATNLKDFLETFNAE